MAAGANGSHANYFTVTGLVSSHWKRWPIRDDDSRIDDMNGCEHISSELLRSHLPKDVSRILLKCKDDPDELVEVILYNEWANDSSFINPGDEVTLEVSHCQVRDMRDEMPKTGYSYSIALQPDDPNKPLIFIRVSRILTL